MNSVLLLVALPLGAAPLAYLVGRLTGRGAGWTAVVALAGGWIAWVAARSAPLPEWTLGAVALRADGLALLIAALALGLGLAVALFSLADLPGRNAEKYQALLLLEVGAVVGLALSDDLFNLWLWFEAMALASYALVAFHRDEPGALAAGVKYLALSAAGSTLALVGVALTIGRTGTPSLAAIRAQADHSPELLAAGALLLVGFGVKAGFVPLHGWLPDAYAQAPGGISALLSGLVTKLGFVAALRALAALAGVSPSWGVLLMAFGALNVLVGNLAALRQTDLKRMLAYSSLAHLGYVFAGAGLGVRTAEAAGFQGSFFHLLTHGVMSGAAFLAVGALLHGLRPNRRADGRLTARDLAGAAGRYPFVAFVLALALLGLGGLPPLAGFMSKWQVFAAGFAAGDALGIGLVLFLAVNSVLSLAYYAPVVGALYRQRPSELVERAEQLPWTIRAPLGALAAAIVLIGVWPGVVAPLTEPAALALARAFGG